MVHNAPGDLTSTHMNQCPDTVSLLYAEEPEQLYGKRRASLQLFRQFKSEWSANGKLRPDRSPTSV